VPEAAHVAAGVGELGVTGLVHIKLEDFVPSGWSEAIQSLDFHDYRYPSALHIERGLFVPQAPAAALNECLVTFAHLPPTYRHHFRDVAVLGGISDGLCMLLDLCWHLTASNA
jgi:hypothetical protein